MYTVLNSISEECNEFDSLHGMTGQDSVFDTNMIASAPKITHFAVQAQGFACS